MAQADTRDTLADDIVAKIDYDFDAIGVPSSAVRQTALRAKMLDDRVRHFVAEHPDAVVVDLGAGLGTAMLRVAPPMTVDWYSVDLPEVIALRDELLPAATTPIRWRHRWPTTLGPIRSRRTGPRCSSPTACWRSCRSR